MGKFFEWVVENLDFLLTVTFAVIVSILVSLSLIPDNWMAITTLSVLIALTLFLAVKNYRLSNRINTITTSLQNMEQKIVNLASARVLSGTKEFFQTLNSLMNEESKLDVTYFSATPPDELPGEEAKKYWKTLAAHLKKSPNFRVTRIATVENSKKWAWIKHTMDDSRTSNQYHLAILEEKNLPLLNLVIVDNQYVIMFGPHAQTTDSHYIFVDNGNIATAANEYFQNLWKYAKPLKLGREINQELYCELEKQFNPQNTK